MGSSPPSIWRLVELSDEPRFALQLLGSNISTRDYAKGRYPFRPNAGIPRHQFAGLGEHKIRPVNSVIQLKEPLSAGADPVYSGFDKNRNDLSW